jgi:NDP-sugar pyrophosphorylase family protein
MIHHTLYLCAGYGSRLERDLVDNNRHDLLGIPKALIPLNKIPLLDYWVRLAKGPQYIVCNDLHFPQFKAWARSANFPVANIYSNGTSSNETRSGSCKDLYDAIKHFNLASSPLLVIAGDTLLKQFYLTEFLQQVESIPGSVVVNYEISDEQCRKSGVLEVCQGPEGTKIVGFLEKPDPADTVSRLGCPCFYYFTPHAINALSEFMAEKLPLGREHYDASGSFIAWLISKSPVYTIPIAGRLDIGGLDSYIEAEEYLLALDNQ